MRWDEPNTVKREIAWEHDRFMVVHPDGDDQTTWKAQQQSDPRLESSEKTLKGLCHEINNYCEGLL